MIYDCFTFFNELELLEIRLNVMDKFVDKFVLVESTKTFTGKDKPLYYQDNKEKFTQFNDRIIHVIVDETPNMETAWANECIQRNAIAKGLVNCNDDDTIIISDLDEIPKPEFIDTYKDIEGIKLFEINIFLYYLNCKEVHSGVWILGPKMLSYKDFKNYTNDKQEYIPYGEHLIKELNEGTTPSTIRYFRHTYHIKNGGWHFTCLGGAEALFKKYQSFSHTELNTEENQDLNHLKNVIKYHKGYTIVPLGKSFPQYIIDNKEKYFNLIKKIEPIERVKYLLFLGFKKIFNLYNEYSGFQKRKVIVLFGIKIKFKRRQRL